MDFERIEAGEKALLRIPEDAREEHRMAAHDLRYVDVLRKVAVLRGERLFEVRPEGGGPEGLAWEGDLERDLRPYGYAPGGYNGLCLSCGEERQDLDKRAIRCRECAAEMATANPSAVRRLAERDRRTGAAGRAPLWGPAGAALGEEERAEVLLRVEEAAEADLLRQVGVPVFQLEVIAESLSEAGRIVAGTVEEWLAMPEAERALRLRVRRALGVSALLAGQWLPPDARRRRARKRLAEGRGAQERITGNGGGDGAV